jgi:hypothetical protein
VRDYEGNREILRVEYEKPSPLRVFELSRYDLVPELYSMLFIIYVTYFFLNREYIMNWIIQTGPNATL